MTMPQASASGGRFRGLLEECSELAARPEFGAISPLPAWFRPTRVNLGELRRTLESKRRGTYGFHDAPARRSVALASKLKGP